MVITFEDLVTHCKKQYDCNKCGRIKTCELLCNKFGGCVMPIITYEDHDKFNEYRNLRIDVID